MTDDLKDAHREAIIAVLAANERVERAVLFGSRATGTNTVSSDVDIALFGDRLTLTDQARLAAALDEMPMAQTVDLLLYTSIQDGTLREHIQRQGVEWFAQRPHEGNCKASPELAPEWLSCTVAEACSAIDYGLTAAASNQPNGLKFLRITDIVSGRIDWSTVPYVTVDSDTVEKYRLHHADIVLARTGASTGFSAYVKNPPRAVFASYLVRLQARPGFDGRFLAYYLKSERFRQYIRGVLGDKSAQPNASASTMTAAPFRAPRDPNEQRAIAHILGAFDDKIELNRGTNETLEAMARALFKSWFVDFDPVRAKMEGRDTGLPQHISDLFPDRLVDSEMGEMPEGWEAKSLKDCMNLTMGQSPPGRTYNDRGEGLPFFQGRAEFGFRYPQKRRFCSEPTRVADAEDTLVSVRAPVGDINLAWERCCIGRGVAALRHKSGSSSFTYHSAWALQRELHEYEHTGTVFGAINKGQFEALKVIEPDLHVVGAFDSMSAHLDGRIRSIVSESHTLAALRDTLLPRLISGEIRVCDADRAVEAVT